VYVAYVAIHRDYCRNEVAIGNGEIVMKSDKFSNIYYWNMQMVYNQQAGQ